MNPQGEPKGPPEVLAWRGPRAELVLLQERHADLLAALAALVEPIRQWCEDDRGGYDQAIGLLCATEDTVRELLRQHRDGRTPHAPEEP